MRSDIAQSVSGENDSPEQNQVVKEGLGDNEKQNTNQTRNNNRQEEEKQTKSDYTGYPSESDKKLRKGKQDRELHWVPQEFSTTNKKVQNWFVQQAQEWQN